MPDAMEIQTQLEELYIQAKNDFDAAADIKTWNDCRVKYLGRNSEIQSHLKGLGKMSPDERPQAGKLINEYRQKIQKLCDEAEVRIQNKQWDSLAETDALDITEPAKELKKGTGRTFNFSSDENGDSTDKVSFNLQPVFTFFLAPKYSLIFVLVLCMS